MSYVEEWVTAYEQEYGRKPSEESIRIAKHIDKVGDMLREHGQEDAQEGKQVYPDRVFVELAQRAFHNGLDEETAQIIGDLWKSDYMDGYQEGSAT